MLPAKQERSMLATNPHQNSKKHLTTQNTATFQKALKTPTFSSNNTLKCTQAREQGTHIVRVGKKNPPVPKFFIKHRKGSCSWHPLTLVSLLSLSTWGILLFLLGDVPFGLIHIVLQSVFRWYSPKVTSTIAAASSPLTGNSWANRALLPIT